MKKHIALAGWIVLLALVGGFGSAAQIKAQSTTQTGQIDAFTFFIPYETDQLDEQFTIDRSDGLNVTGIEIIISIAIHRSDSIIYYDQWEDGLEPILSQPGQFTTQVWGDNDSSNGTPPGLEGRDVLQADDVIILRNVVPLPRDPAQLFFDGGDSFTSVGGAIAASLTFWPNPDPGPLFADAWELYPTNRWGNDYRIPIGENLAGTGPNQRGGFTVVGLNVQAVEDDTQVEVDLDGNGSVDRTETLNQGQQLNEVQGIRTGARVQASAPVQVHLFATDPSQDYEARGYTMVPFDQWTDDYLAPRSSDGDFWLYNPNGSDLQVEVETNVGTTTITIPANSTIKFPDVGLSAATGTRFSSTDGDPFYGVAALDADDAQDWGYAVLPFNRLATQTLVGLGIGNNNDPPGPGNDGDGFESRVYVTAVDDTTISVDYDNDGTVDADFPVSPLQEVAITDPADFDMTGAFLFTDDGVPFAAVWGQDESANPALPSIDAGTGIVPLPSLLLQKTFNSGPESDCSGTITRGDTIQFKLQYFNNTVNPIRNVVIADSLPSAVTYQPNTTQLNGALIPDDSSGATPFLLDEAGYNVGDVERLGTGTLTFDVVINDDNNPIINRADASSQDLPLGSDFVIVVAATQPTPPLLQVSKTLIDPADGFVTNGQTITFGLTITNTSSVVMTALRLQDTFNADHLAFLNANPPPNLPASGVITWDDLTATFGDLAPGAAINTTVSFAVGQLYPTITNTVNTVVVHAQRDDTPAPLICQTRGSVDISPPPEPGIHVKKATNGFDADDPNNDQIPQIKPGDPVTWDYVVTNIGNVPLSNVTLVDDQGVSPTFMGGDANNDGRLDLSETWLYQATGVAEDLPNSNRPRSRCGPGGIESPIYTNMATASGQFGPTTVVDEDPSHYCSPPPPPTSTPPPSRTDTPPPPTSTPPPSTPPAIGQITPTPVLPVVLLPETGLKEVSQPNRAIIFWLLTLIGVNIVILYSRYRC